MRSSYFGFCCRDHLSDNFDCILPKFLAFWLCVNHRHWYGAVVAAEWLLTRLWGCVNDSAINICDKHKAYCIINLVNLIWCTINIAIQSTGKYAQYYLHEDGVFVEFRNANNIVCFFFIIILKKTCFWYANSPW